jgi:phosphoribosylformylglycinamidine cyclo-ligase
VYKRQGVDILAGQAFVQKIRHLVDSTKRPEVIGGLGGFSGLFALPQGYAQPVLVAGTDGVGTKLKIAHSCHQHHTIGIDLVAMCVNDVLTCGAEPLFFLDYLATGKLEPDQLLQVVAGIAEGCKQAGCALIGGETAEMPGFYASGEYDVAGFCVGIVERDKIIDGSRVQVGDRVVGLPSSGLHSNGFSLVRQIVADRGLAWDAPSPVHSDRTLGAECLTPTRIYVSLIKKLLEEGWEIHGLAHITGGGLPENLPRCLGQNQSVLIDRSSWQVPPIFRWLAEVGQVSEVEMFNTFNMGIGMAIVLPPESAAHLCTDLPEARIIGEVIHGGGELVFSQAGIS